MTAALSLRPIVPNRVEEPQLHRHYMVVGPEGGAPIDGKMAVIGTAESAVRCRDLVVDLLANSDNDRVFLSYLAIMRTTSIDGFSATLGGLLQDEQLAEIHFVAVSQRVRHRVSGLEAAAALFGVFGSDYLRLGAHFLGLCPSTLVSALERDEIPSAVQKLIAAIVANARPFTENGLIEAVERVDLMLPVGVDYEFTEE